MNLSLAGTPQRFNVIESRTPISWQSHKDRLRIVNYVEDIPRRLLTLGHCMCCSHHNSVALGPGTPKYTTAMYVNHVWALNGQQTSLCCEALLSLRCKVISSGDCWP